MRATIARRGHAGRTVLVHRIPQAVAHRENLPLRQAVTEPTRRERSDAADHVVRRVRDHASGQRTGNGAASHLVRDEEDEKRAREVAEAEECRRSPKTAGI